MRGVVAVVAAGALIVVMTGGGGATRPAASPLAGAVEGQGRAPQAADTAVARYDKPAAWDPYHRWQPRARTWPRDRTWRERGSGYAWGSPWAESPAPRWGRQTAPYWSGPRYYGWGNDWQRRQYRPRRPLYEGWWGRDWRRAEGISAERGLDWLAIRAARGSGGRS